MTLTYGMRTAVTPAPQEIEQAYRKLLQLVIGLVKRHLITQKVAPQYLTCLYKLHWFLRKKLQRHHSLLKAFMGLTGPPCSRSLAMLWIKKLILAENKSLLVFCWISTAWPAVTKCRLLSFYSIKPNPEMTKFPKKATQNNCTIALQGIFQHNR